MVNSHDLSSLFNETNLIYQHGCLMKKQDEAHESECSHVKHFCETNYLNSFVLFSPVTVPVHYSGISKRLECKVWGVNKMKCWVGNVVRKMCDVVIVDCEV